MIVCLKCYNRMTHSESGVKLAAAVLTIQQGDGPVYLGDVFVCRSCDVTVAIAAEKYSGDTAAWHKNAFRFWDGIGSKPEGWKGGR